MSSKIFYCTKVVAYGILCIITKLEFFQHHFSKMGHGNTSCDPHLHLSHSSYQRSATSRAASAAGRLRPNAVTGKLESHCPVTRLPGTDSWNRMRYMILTMFCPECRAEYRPVFTR